VSKRSTTRQLITLIVVFLVLLLLVGGVGALYWSLTRPPALKEVTQRDRRFLFSIYGYEGDLLRRPSGVAVGPNGRIYVADTGKKRVVVFEPDGTFVTAYGEIGQEPLKLWEPLGVAVAPDGRSYVLDKSQKKIVFYDSTYTPVKEVVLNEEAPLSVTVANDLLFVTTESGIVISDLDGNLQTGYVKRGKKPGEFDRPGGVAVAPDGTLYVADSLNYRVQAISPQGKPLWQYGKPLPEGATRNMTQDTGQAFGLPASIALDERGYLYVSDGLNSEVVVLTTDGELVERIGDVGHDDGKFYYPDGIAYSDGRIVVADKYNDRVEVFSVPRPGAAQWAPWVPWVLLALALPLLLVPFLLRRRTRYVVTPAFLEQLAADEEHGPRIAKIIRTAYAEPELAERGSGIEGLDLKKREAPSS
jgi:DNA-binding beta-propeller fold protein YncE